MFNFTHVLNATTGDRYFIRRAELTNDEGYDETPDGANWFTVDLEPEDSEDDMVLGIDLIIYNNGYAVNITRNLNPNHRWLDAKSDGTVMTDTVDALIEGKTLIIVERDAPQKK